VNKRETISEMDQILEGRLNAIEERLENIEKMCYSKHAYNLRNVE